jgi:hypothetical protein
MPTPTQIEPSLKRHQSPPLGIVAIVFMVLFCAGLLPVSPLGGTPNFPTPWEPASAIVAFFRARPDAVALCAFLQFGSAVPLGIFTASAVSRMRFLGVKAAGPNIALFGGFSTAFVMMAGATILWTLARPGIAQDTSLTTGLYYLGYALGGPAYSVSFGLLTAGLSVPVFFTRHAPRWIAIFGLALAVIGELSWMSLQLPGASFLIPLTRFPGFIWMIAMGFALPTTATRGTAGGAE